MTVRDGDDMRRRRMMQWLTLLFAGSLWPGLVSAQPVISWTGQPESHELRMEHANITGFANIRFGMGVQQVEQLLAESWPGVPIVRENDSVQRTVMLNINLPELSAVDSLPAPAPATVTCIFGYRSGTLMAVNVNWYAEGDAADSQRQALLEAGSAYVAEMLAYYWDPLQTARGHVIDTNAIMMFAGRDRQGHGVQVRVEGVPLDVLRPDGGSDHRPVTEGPAQLHIGVSSTPDKPDVYRLPDNSF